MYYMLLGTGFEETEAVAPLDLLRRAGIKVATVGLNGKTIVGSHGIPITADLTIEELDLTSMEGVILPGGLRGVASIRASRLAMDAISFAWENHLLTAAICAGPTVLADLGIPDGRKATCYPGCEENMGKAIMVEKAAYHRTCRKARICRRYGISQHPSPHVGRKAADENSRVGAEYHGSAYSLYYPDH